MARAGAVWLDVLPSMAGFNRAVETGARARFGSIGKASGAEWSTAFTGSAKQGMAGFRAAVEAEAAAAAREVTAASAKVAAARKREADAAGAVRVAETKLQEVRAKGNATASQTAVAEERLAKAQRDLGVASGSTAAREGELTVAEKAQGDAAAVASEKTATAGLRMREFGASAQSGFGRAATAAKGASKVMLGFAAFGVADFAYHSLKAAGDFQASMNLLVTAGGESKQALNLVAAGVKSIAVQTGTSTKDLADGMYVLEKAGLRGASGLTVLKAAAQGARAENVDLGTMTNALTSIMRSYDLPASAAVRVTNQLVAASGAAKTTMQDFAGSLATVLPIASAAHISFAQVGGAIATLTSHGTSAQEATQELAFSIRSLQAPNHVAINMMAQFGLSSNDVSQKLGKRGLTGTIDLLSQTILHRMGPSGTALLHTFNASKVAAQDAATMMNHLPPAAKRLAQSFEAGKLSMKDWRAGIKFMSAPQAALASQWVTMENKAKGFNSELRGGGQPAMTYTAALKAMMGGAAGLNTALQLSGGSAATFTRNVDEVGKAGLHAGKDVSTWATTQKNFNVILGQFREQVAVAAINVGTKLIPALSSALTWVQKNWTLLKDLAIGLGVAYAATKLWTVATWAWTAAGTAWTVAAKAAALAQRGITAALGIGQLIASKVATLALAVAQKAAAVASGLWKTAQLGVSAAMDVGKLVAVRVQTLALAVAQKAAAAAAALWSLAVRGARVGLELLIGRSGIARVQTLALATAQKVAAAASAVWGGAQRVAGLALDAGQLAVARVRTLALAVAQRVAAVASAVWAAAQRLLSLALSPVMLIAATAQTLALAAAQRVAAVASGIWAAAQRLLGLTMSGSGLIVAKIQTVALSVAQKAAGVATALWAGAQRIMNAVLDQGILRYTASKVATVAMFVAQKAIAVATKAWAAAQWLINAALTANPIGLVIALVAGLAAGIIYAYKHSDTFRTIVQAAFKAVADAGRFMWENVLRPAFKAIVDTFLAVAGAIVNGAARAFGWVPGIGGKLKAAAKTFNTFRDQVNASLAGVHDKTVTVTGKAIIDANSKVYAAQGAKNFAQLKMAEGGRVPLVAGARYGMDSVPAVLMPDEFVVRADGSNLVDALRHFGAPGYAQGGLIPLARTSGAAQPGLMAQGVLNSIEAGVAGALKSGLSAAIAAAAASGAFGVGGSTAGPLGLQAVALARQYLGTPYLWGGMHPGGFDCSGLVDYIYTGLGHPLPRTASAMQAGLTQVPLGSAAIGDLLFFGGAAGRGGAHHVGFNLGGGMMLDAPTTGSFVRIESLRGWPDLTSAARPYDTGGMLQPGLQMVYNGTNKPEPVLTDRQWNVISDRQTEPAQGGDQFNFNVQTATFDENALRRYERRRELTGRVGRPR